MQKIKFCELSSEVLLRIFPVAYKLLFAFFTTFINYIFISKLSVSPGIDMMHFNTANLNPATKNFQMPK